MLFESPNFLLPHQSKVNSSAANFPVNISCSTHTISILFLLWVSCNWSESIMMTLCHPSMSVSIVFHPVFPMFPMTAGDGYDVISQSFPPSCPMTTVSCPWDNRINIQTRATWYTAPQCHHHSFTRSFSGFVPAYNPPPKKTWMIKMLFQNGLNLGELSSW